ncbi:MAG: DUF3800 domain-containing protein [Sinimarinibacterium flocculans]|uniref:DUF3800 domain-containing protein n=1 Tax=Sinimarinibacterium flocculans TaxID=985250 RepID=UPI003C65609D
MSDRPWLEIYADESSQNSHRFLLLGALAVRKNSSAEIADALMSVREKHALSRHEIKWGRVSTCKLEGYKAIADCLFEYVRTDAIHIHTMAVDTWTFNHNKHSSGDHEAGFNKLIYQLLLHKAGIRYGATCRLDVHLDHRKTSQQPSDLRRMLNAGAAQRGIKTHPFRHVGFRDSKECGLIQACDLVIGSIAYRKNGHYSQPVANPAKKAMVKHLLDLIRDCQPHHPQKKEAKRFTFWNFCYRKR